MFIKQARVRKIEKYINHLKSMSKFFVGVKNPTDFKDKMLKAGFTEKLELGESVLPAAVFGPISWYNAEGKSLVNRGKPMETAYRVVKWHWREWHGPYERIERSKLVDVPYKRYPRTFIAPPSIELKITSTVDNIYLVISPLLINSKEDGEINKHIINLFLEIFGECQIFSENLQEIVKTPIKRLNWKILPRGKFPWPKLQRELTPLIQNIPQGKRTIYKARLELLYSYNPNFTALGKGGFKGYIIFGFPEQELYLCESLYYENATYIFGQNWQELSKMTKAEILDQSLQKKRIIHRSNWDTRVKKLLVNNRSGD